MILCFTLNCIITLCVSTAHHSLYDAEVRKISSLIRACFAYTHRVWTRAFNLICKSKHQIKNVVSKAQTKLLQDIWATCGTSRPRQPLFFSVLTAKPKVGTGICVISCVENICKGN